MAGGTVWVIQGHTRSLNHSSYILTETLLRGCAGIQPQSRRRIARMRISLGIRLMLG